MFYTMRRGEIGNRVRLVQHRLGQVEGEPGLFDAAMEESVKAFQVSAGLIADGVIGLQTFSRLYRLG